MVHWHLIQTKQEIKVMQVFFTIKRKLFKPTKCLIITIVIKSETKKLVQCSQLLHGMVACRMVPLMYMYVLQKLMVPFDIAIALRTGLSSSALLLQISATVFC